MTNILHTRLAAAVIRAAGDDPHAQADPLKQIIVQHEYEQKLQRAILSADARLPFD